MRSLFLAAVLLAPNLAAAEGRGVLVVNHGPETIRSIQIGPAGSGHMGENRLRSQLPPGAQGRIGYTSGCSVDVRLGFESGRTEDFPGQDACTESQVVSGQGTAGAASAPLQHAATTARGHRGKETAQPALASKVVVPPWTGHSITKKFGGLD